MSPLLMHDVIMLPARHGTRFVHLCGSCVSSTFGLGNKQIVSVVQKPKPSPWLYSPALGALLVHAGSQDLCCCHARQCSTMLSWNWGSLQRWLLITPNSNVSNGISRSPNHDVPSKNQSAGVEDLFWLSLEALSRAECVRSGYSNRRHTPNPAC